MCILLVIGICWLLQEMQFILSPLLQPVQNHASRTCICQSILKMTHYVLGPVICTENVINYLLLVYFIVVFHHVMTEVTCFTMLLATKLRTEFFKNCWQEAWAIPGQLVNSQQEGFIAICTASSCTAGARRGRNQAVSTKSHSYTAHLFQGTHFAGLVIYNTIQTNWSQLHQKS